MEVARERAYDALIILLRKPKQRFFWVNGGVSKCGSVHLGGGLSKKKGGVCSICAEGKRHQLKVAKKRKK